MLLLALLLQVPVPPPPVPAGHPVAAAAVKEVPPARIVLTTPFPVHLGSVGPREVREAEYGIRSTADHPFRFRLLDVSLGVSLEEGQLAEPLQPGEVRMLRLKVATTGMEGFVKGAVRLGTDDPAQPTYILRFDMLVRPEVAVDQARKSLGDVAPFEGPEVHFRFIREGGDPLKLVLASVLPSYLESEWVPREGGTDLRLTLRPARLEPGTTAGLEVIKVATNAPRQPLFTLYLDWRIATATVPTPSRLVFTDLKTTLEGLELKARDGKPFRLLQAEIQGKGFELLDRPSAAATRHVLRVRRVGCTPEAMLVLRCSNMDAPLRVPLRFLDPALRPASTAVPPMTPPAEEHHHH